MATTTNKQIDLEVAMEEASARRRAEDASPVRSTFRTGARLVRKSASLAEAVIDAVQLELDLYQGDRLRELSEAELKALLLVQKYKS